MSSLDELCAMLADRREEFFVNDFGVNWRYYRDPHTATVSMDGTLIVTGLTPEQAVIATLGTGTCHDVAGMDDVFECSACGGRYQAWAIKRWARYCPDCGKKIVAS